MQSNNPLILPTAYFGNISYYRAMLLYGEASSPLPDIHLEAWETFPKQTYRNRCRIMGANGVQTLTVPVQKSETKQFTRDVRISYQTAWQHQHWNALRSAYEHTPYFDYYADFFLPLYTARYTFLWDFNLALHEVVINLLQQPLPPLQPTDTWSGDTDLDRYFTSNTPYPPYYQIFADKHGFQENLSIVDLLFNQGVEALQYL